MTRSLLAGLFAAVGLAGHSAAAADLDGGAPTAVGAPATLPIWSGFYLGAGVGGRSADAEWTTTGLGEGPTVADPFTTGNPASFDLSGSRISVFLGHNWQFSNWVLGVEADLGWGDTEESRIGIPGSLAAFGPSLADTASVKNAWDASLRARLGYLASPNLLLYATAGPSWTRSDVSASCAGPLAPVSLCPSFLIPGVGVVGNRSQTASDVLAGSTVGGGLEWRLARNWLLRGEYRFSDYESADFTFFGKTDINEELVRFEVDQQTHTVSLGLSYLFPGGRGRPRAPVPGRDLGYDWSGFYVGPHVGGVWTDTELTDFTGDLAPPNIPGSILRVDADGFLAGGQLGFDYRASPWVFGIEAQGAWANASGSIVPVSVPPPSQASFRVSSNVDWLATVTGRVGFALGSALPYVEGGWALAGESYSADFTVLGASIPIAGSSGQRSGWVVGAGVEWPISDRWTARLEYNFMDFGTERRSIRAAGAPPTPFDVDLDAHTVTFGLKYRFGPAPPADRL